MSRRVMILAGICVALAVLGQIQPSAPTVVPIDFTLPATPARIEIIERHADPIVLQRRDGAWFIGDAPVDRHAQAALTAAFTQPVPMDARVEAPSPGRFGLGEGALAVQIGEIRVDVGKVADGRHTFIRAPDGNIYRARINLRALFDRPAHTWPERRVFALPDDGVTGVVLKRGAHVVWGFEKGAEGWRFTAGGDRLDQNQAAGIAHMLATLRAERFEAPSRFPVRLTVDLQTTQGPRTIEIGASTRGSASARISGRPGQLRIPKAVISLLDLPAAALTDRRLFRGDPTAVTAITLHTEAGVQRVERDGAGWRAALLQLTALSAPPVVPPDAFAQPQISMIVESGATRWTLTLGKPYQRGARYARTSDGDVVIVGPATLRELAAPVLDDP